MDNHLSEEKNQTVDKPLADGVALDSVATHLSKAIADLSQADEYSLASASLFSQRSIASSLIALTQIFSYQTNSSSTTSPRSNSAAAYSPESLNDTQSQPTEDQSVHSEDGATQPLAETDEPDFPDHEFANGLNASKLIFDEATPFENPEDAILARVKRGLDFAKTHFENPSSDCYTFTRDELVELANRVRDGYDQYPGSDPEQVVDAFLATKEAL